MLTPLLTVSTPLLRLVDRSCSRSGSGISSITPDIGRPCVAWRCCAPASSRRRASPSPSLARRAPAAPPLLRGPARAGDDLDDRRADQDAIALVQQRTPGDLLAVDERAVGRAHVLDVDLGLRRADLGVGPRAHVPYQHPDGAA